MAGQVQVAIPILYCPGILQTQGTCFLLAQFMAMSVHDQLKVHKHSCHLGQVVYCGCCILLQVAAFVGKIVACTMSVLDNVAGKRA